MREERLDSKKGRGEKMERAKQGEEKEKKVGWKRNLCLCANGGKTMNERGKNAGNKS